MVQFEYSAGAFIFLKERGSSAFKLLLLKKSNGEYDIPKGHIEKGESSEQAAVREIREETGIHATLLPYFHSDTKYFFRKGKKTILKHVRFFLVEAEDDRVKISFEHKSHAWLDPNDFRERIKFKDIVKMLPEVLDYILRYMQISKINDEYASLPKNAKNWDLSSRLVPGEGPLNADIMLIGQAPGRFEDESGRPFIGRSGRLLDEMIKSARMKRNKLYITSVVQFFPPKNRIPTPEEIRLCKPLLIGQISVIKPKFIILLGNVALEAVLGMKSVHAHHGTVIENGSTTYMITLHPAAALRFKESKKIMQQDFEKFGKEIKRGTTNGA